MLQVVWDYMQQGSWEGKGNSINTLWLAHSGATLQIT